MAVRVKRVYEAPSADDGRRVLVDRLWPRGFRKEQAQVDEWLRDLAPSDTLRQWFGHQPERWEEFRRRYREEMKASEQARLLLKLSRLAREGTVTLLYAARDGRRNNAVALKEVLDETGR